MSIHGLTMTMNWYTLNFMMPMVMMFSLFHVDKKGQLEAYGGIDGSSDSWDVVSKNIQPINETI